MPEQMQNKLLQELIAFANLKVHTHNRFSLRQTNRGEVLLPPPLRQSDLNGQARTPNRHQLLRSHEQVNF